MNMLFNKADDPDADHSVTATQGLIMEILATAIFVQLILNVTEPSSPSSNWWVYVPYSKVSNKRTVYACLISKKSLPVPSYYRPVRLLVFEFDKKIEPEFIQRGEKMTPSRLLKNVSDLYVYSLGKSVTLYGY